MPETIKEIEAEVKDLFDHKRQAEERLRLAQNREYEARREPLKAIVIRAHDCLCPYNHTDGCSWGYENGNWSSYSHHTWLAHYDKLINGYGPDTKHAVTLDEITEIITMIESLKPRVRTAMLLLRSGRLVP